MDRDEYSRKAEFHLRYLADCRARRNGPNSYVGDLEDIAADEAFCRQAALVFDADSASMVEPLQAAIERVLQRPHTRDLDERAFAKALRQRLKSFRAKAVTGEHFAP